MSQVNKKFISNDKILKIPKSKTMFKKKSVNEFTNRTSTPRNKKRSSDLITNKNNQTFENNKNLQNINLTSENKSIEAISFNDNLNSREYDFKDDLLKQIINLTTFCKSLNNSKLSTYDELKLKKEHFDKNKTENENKVEITNKSKENLIFETNNNNNGNEVNEKTKYIDEIISDSNTRTRKYISLLNNIHSILNQFDHENERLSNFNLSSFISNEDLLRNYSRPSFSIIDDSILLQSKYIIF